MLASFVSGSMRIGRSSASHPLTGTNDSAHVHIEQLLRRAVPRTARAQCQQSDIPGCLLIPCITLELVDFLGMLFPFVAARQVDSVDHIAQIK